MSTIKNNLIKKVCILISLLLAITLISAIPVLAETSKTEDFQFTVPVSPKFAHTSNKYLRDTDNLNRPWKVKMTYSSEKTKGHPEGNSATATNFWLGVYDGSGTNHMGSNKHKVINKNGYYYFGAYSNASYKYVYLYAGDNNTGYGNYSIQGKWKTAVMHSIDEV
ncbi:MAG: DUF2712 domain-containing protein [Eubacterium sp.]